MKTFFIRTLSALVFVVLMVAGIFWNQYSFFLLMTVILVGSLYEYFNITASKRENKRFSWFIIALFVAIYTVISFLSIHGNDFLSAIDALNSYITLVPVVVFILFAAELYNKSETPFENIGWNVIPVFWILIPILLTNDIYFGTGSAFLMAVFGLIWIYDTASYILGSLFGKHKLFKRISPKKTIEGMIGGMTFTIIISYFATRIPQLSQFSGVKWMMLACTIVIAATFGDLVESMLKRNFGVKDSGSILPGHGGFLDRFDAYFFAVPFVVFVLWIIG